MNNIIGIEKMSWDELYLELQQGGKFVVFQYCTSTINKTTKRTSSIYFVKVNENVIRKGIPFSLWSILFGWWGIPWGPIYTIESLIVNFRGGLDVTQEVATSLGLEFFDTRYTNMQVKKVHRIQEMPSISLESLEIRNCPNCGYSYNDPDVTTCSRCGHKLTVGAVQPSCKISKRRHLRIFGIGLLGILVVIGSIALLSKELSIPSKLNPPAVFTPTAIIDVQSPPPGWRNYSNAKLGFSAYIPENWVPEEHPKNPGIPGQAVSFAAMPDDITADSTVITVIAIPMPDNSNTDSLTTAELKQSAEAWIKNRGVALIKPVTETTISLHPAVWMIHEANAVDGSYTVRGYAAFVSTPKWFYYLEVAGFAEYDDQLRRVFETFVEGFRSPEQ